jgi:hypothetical protein
LINAHPGIERAIVLFLPNLAQAIGQQQWLLERVAQSRRRIVGMRLDHARFSSSAINHI